MEERYHLSYLQDPENLSSLKDLARRFFSREVAVGITAVGPQRAEAKNEAGHPADASGSYNDKGNDLVNETLRIFGGSIRGVKREG
ncbi:MAG: hypothetical protein AABZ69_03790 [Candidatus Binatota bacterium]